jgi:serine/threonine-protein kinase
MGAMSVAPGTRLGPYQVTAQLGEGGMGEVYRATDAALKREVAIKVLPAGFAADPDRLARFEREAQLLAQLSHPNIASIYGLHEVEGVPFLAMELVPGETIEQRLQRGKVPLEEVVAIARKLADGLEYAHERGIVHRDLKPANVKLTPEGDVKILDFGLAKAVSGEVAGSGPTSTPTIVPTMTSAGTAVGVILGTAAYMSPEQARGRPVDKRADIWAFGALVYELLSGKRLFDGETVSDTIAAVLTRPIDVEALPQDVPRSLRRLLARCLERDAKLRLRDIGEARIALADTSAADAPVAAPVTTARRSPLLLALVPLALLAGLGVGWWLHAPRGAPSHDARWALAIPEGQTISTVEHLQIAISRDGRQQVLVTLDANAMSHLLLRAEDEFEPRLLPETERAVSPFFSPDGTWIAFFRDMALYKTPVAGGPPTRLAATSGQSRGGTWSRDGFLYFAPDSTAPLQRVREAGGEVENVTTLDAAHGERTHRWPEAVLDGKVVLFTCDDQGSTEYYDDAHIEAVRPATGERKTLIDGASMARYAPSGHLVFARGGALYAVRFDPDTLQTSGTPFPVVQGVATDVSTGASHFALAESGSALWVPGSADQAWREVWIDLAGIEASVAIPPAPYNELALSPDGKRVALAGGAGGISDLWVYDFERDSMARLTVGQYVSHPVWTPDGRHIAFGTKLQGAKAQTNTWQIAWKLADGSADEETLVERERSQLPSSFTPDGRTLVFDGLDQSGARRDIWLLALDGSHEPRLLIGGPSRKYMGMISPDGRWLAYVSNESGQAAVFVRPFPSGEGRWQISTPQGSEPRWSADGKQLFYRADGALRVVPIDTTHGFSAGRPEPLFDRVATGGLVTTYGVAPDGKRIFTFRSPLGVGTQRTVDLDLGFARRLSAASGP